MASAKSETTNPSRLTIKRVRTLTSRHDGVECFVHFTNSSTSSGALQSGGENARVDQLTILQSVRDDCRSPRDTEPSRRRHAFLNSTRSRRIRDTGSEVTGIGETDHRRELRRSQFDHRGLTTEYRVLDRYQPALLRSAINRSRESLRIRVHFERVVLKDYGDFVAMRGLKPLDGAVEGGARGALEVNELNNSQRGVRWPDSKVTASDGIPLPRIDLCGLRRAT
jgi:hypothetical protein